MVAKATRSWPVESCKSRAILRRSSSCKRRSWPDKVPEFLFCSFACGDVLADGKQTLLTMKLHQLDREQNNHHLPGLRSKMDFLVSGVSLSSDDVDEGFSLAEVNPEIKLQLRVTDDFSPRIAAVPLEGFIDLQYAPFLKSADPKDGRATAKSL